MAIDLTEVKSSNIHGIGYDPASKTLAVKFKSGETYHYHGVSEIIHAGLMKSDSKGKFLHAHIRGKHKESRQR